MSGRKGSRAGHIAARSAGSEDPIDPELADRVKEQLLEESSEVAPEAPDELRPFFYDAHRAVTGHDYLRRKWLPREGPLFYVFIQVLRGYCFYNPQTGEVRNSCFPDMEKLARGCGVHRSTLFRLLARDEEGRFLNESLGRFIKIIPRRRYDPKSQREVTTSNLYSVCLDDPVIPEEDELLAEKEAEIAAILAIEVAQEERRRERQALQSSHRSSTSQNATQNAVANRDSVSSRKMRQDRSTSITLTSIDGGDDRYPPEGSHLTIRSGAEDVGKFDRLPSRNELGQKSRINTQTPHRVESRERSGAAAGDARRGQLREVALNQHYLQLLAAEEEAGGVIGEILQELGDTNVPIGSKIILQALVEAETPTDALVPLVYLGRERLMNFRIRGGQVANRSRYYTTIMRNLAQEARDVDWNLELLEVDERTAQK